MAKPSHSPSDPYPIVGAFSAAWHPTVTTVAVTAAEATEETATVPLAS